MAVAVLMTSQHTGHHAQAGQNRLRCCDAWIGVVRAILSQRPGLRGDVQSGQNSYAFPAICTSSKPSRRDQRFRRRRRWRNHPVRPVAEFGSGLGQDMVTVRGRGVTTLSRPSTRSTWLHTRHCPKDKLDSYVPALAWRSGCAWAKLYPLFQSLFMGQWQCQSMKFLAHRPELIFGSHKIVWNRDRRVGGEEDGVAGRSTSVHPARRTSGKPSGAGRGEAYLRPRRSAACMASRPATSSFAAQGQQVAA